MPRELLRSETIAVGGAEARVLWRRNPRARRVSLSIEPQGGRVVVTLPPRSGRRAGLALLRAEAGWVSAHLAALPGAVPFVPGAVVPLGGVPYRIRHRPECRRGVWLEGEEIAVSGAAAFLARRVRDFLRAEARRTFLGRVAEKAAGRGLVARRVSVRDTLSRWGSCGADGALSFSWRLVMAPPFVQDYVVAHEVAHLRHLNHGPRFWGLVAELTPHREAAVAWLRAEGPRLLRIGES